MKTKQMRNKPSQRLQKVTESKNARLTTLEETFKKEKVTPHDLPLDSVERKRLTDKIEAHINSLRGSDLDEYLEKIEAIIGPESDIKNQTWERAHSQIAIWLGRLMREYNRVPTVTEIAKETNYSRKTIHSHLKEFESSTFFQEEKQKFKLLNSTIMSRLFEMGFQGDVKACKLFLECTGEIKSKNGTVNYIQINSLLVTEDTIKLLPQVRLAEIEDLIKKAISEIN